MIPVGLLLASAFMASVLSEPTSVETFADLWERLGKVPLDRILMHPAPGTATPADVLRLADAAEKRLCELVDGVLVEKAMGQRESRLAFWLGHKIANYLDEHDRGIAFGADGPSQLSEVQVRFPDLGFIAYDRIPAGADPDTPMPDWIPNLAIEVISPGNTKGEMLRKLKDFFAAGVELVWYIDPAKRTVRVYTSVDDCTILKNGDTLDGGDVLPGFRVSIRELFEKARKIRPGRK